VTLNAVPDGVTVPELVRQFQQATGVNFPLFDKVDVPFLNAADMGKTLGYLAGTQAINTFINVRVLKKFENVNTNPPKYILNIGEPWLTQQIHYYQDPAVGPMSLAIQAAFQDILKGKSLWLKSSLTHCFSLPSRFKQGRSYG
jgi:hypothetical protein